MLTHAWSTVAINALLRSGSSQIGWLYARFGDSGANPAYLSPAANPSDLGTTVASDFLHAAPGDNVRGGLWVPILAAPSQSSSNPNLYTGNQATFSFRIPGNIPAAQISPAANFNPATSYIYALGLAVPVVAGDRTQDIIVALQQNFTIFQVPANGQEAVDYPLQILT